MPTPPSAPDVVVPLNPTLAEAPVNKDLSSVEVTPPGTMPGAPIATSVIPGARIQVIANMPGYLGNRQRIAAGDVFTVKDMSQVAFWMRCTDPTLEREHQAILERKRLAERAHQHKQKDNEAGD